MNRLAGITRPSTRFGGTPFSNPTPHAPVLMQNRVQAEVIGPDGAVKHRIDHSGNIMATYGLNRLIEMLASDTNGASRWASAMAIGTSTTAAASTQDSLVASTQIIHLSQASMVASDGGARTLQYNGTFASNGNACQIHEVGLFATNNATQNMIARSVLGTDSINRGASDEIRISYQVIAGTA
jgi:hypothetical protein